MENSSRPSQSKPLEVEDNDSDWSLSSVEMQDINMRAEEEAELDELPSRVSMSALNDDMSQMSKIPAPEKPHLKSSTNVLKIGKLMTFVNEFMIVESTDTMVLDLDNYVFDKDRRVLGFVADVLGPIDKPFYAIKLESLDIIPTLQVGQPIYFSEGSRLLGKEVINNLKTPGTDGLGEKEFDSDSDGEVKSDKGPIKRRYESTTNEQEPKSKRYQPRQQNQQQIIPEIYRTYQQQPPRQQYQSQYNPIPMNYPYPMQQLPIQYSIPQSPMPQSQYPMMPAPTNPINPEQQMYLQGLYKQYYDQMIQFYNK